MPLPAGSGLSRRTFLTRTAGLALSVYGASKLPFGLFEEGIARAAAPTDPVLVSIFLDGGADSLSMLYPAGDAQYAGLRPHLALAPEAGEPFAEDASLHWHPSLAPLAELHGEGKVSVLPAVGYTNADQSHFTSRHYWEVGATDAICAPAGWGAISIWPGQRTTRSRGSRSPTRSTLRSPLRASPSQPFPGSTTMGSGRTVCGGSRRRACSTQSARSRPRPIRAAGTSPRSPYRSPASAANSFPHHGIGAARSPIRRAPIRFHPVSPASRP